MVALVRALGLAGAMGSLLGACATGSDDPSTPGPPVLGDDGPAATAMADDSDSGAVDTDGATSMGTGGPGATSAGPSGGDTGSVDSTGAGDESGPGSTSGGPPPVCPPDGSDGACLACGKMHCCGEYLACQVEANCSCALDCYLAAMMPPEDCILMCGISNEAIDVFNCAALSCSEVCS